jgi:O-antigen/teichoic acid export membrane protein
VAGEAQTSFFILAGSLPLLFAANTLRGAMEATQRFDLVNSIKVPTTVCVFLLPAAAVFAGRKLPGILWSLAGLWFCATAAYGLGCRKLFPALRQGIVFDRSWLRPLLVYGGWVQVSNLLNPLLGYVDRLVLAATASMSAVGFYTAPYDAINRAWVLPGSLTATLFPAFSSLEAGGSRRQLEELCVRSLKSVLLILGPVLLLVIAFARQILQLWLGPEFAARSTAVLEILAVGALFNAIAILPFSFLQGLGRPDLTASFHLIELPLYIATLWVLVGRWGITGAALAWTLRVAFDALLLFAAVVWLKLVSPQSFASSSVRRTFGFVFLFGVFLIPAWAWGSPALQAASAALLLSAFAAVAWNFVLDGSEKNLIRGIALELRSALALARSR